VTVTITPADLDDPRVGTLLDDHLAEMEPTAPPESRHGLTIDQFRMPGVHLWVADARALYTGAGFTPCGPFGDYRPDRHSTFLTLAL
jgi:putative acetyltransferase